MAAARIEFENGEGLHLGRKNSYLTADESGKTLDVLSTQDLGAVARESGNEQVPISPGESELFLDGSVTVTGMSENDYAEAIKGTRTPSVPSLSSSSPSRRT